MKKTKTSTDLTIRHQLINDLIYCVLNKPNGLSSGEASSFWEVVENIWGDNVSLYSWPNYTKYSAIKWVKKTNIELYNAILPWISRVEETDV